MKKTLIAIFFTFLYTGLVKAQDIYYGPKVGANITHILYSGDDVISNNNQMILSSHLGVFAEFIFTDFFSVQPELLYSVKGARFSDSNDIDFKSAYIYKYLSLPIVVKYYVTEEISVEVGPQIAYLLSAKNVETSEFLASSLGQEAASVDIKEDMQVYDFGATAGVGYLTKNGIYVSARYNMGLLNTFKTDTDFTDTFKNGAIQLSVGFSFQ